MKQKSEFDARRYVQLFMAGYVPRSKDEKKFVDKHVAQLHQDVNGNKDDVFKATNVPTHKRPPYHGYEKGQDERMYEDVEPIQEVSKDKLFRYITSATADLRLKSHKAGIDASQHPSTPEGMSDLEKRNKRQRGIGTAAKKLAYGKVSEETISEESKLKFPNTFAVWQIKHGTDVVSDHKGDGGHLAEVRYSKVRKDYQVHHYSNDVHMGADAISYHDTKKDAEATAKYTTTVRNNDYVNHHVGENGLVKVPKGSNYGIEPKSTDEILRARGGIKEAIEALEEEMSDAQMAKRERIVKSMKKKAGTFEKRYGDKAKDVMYATATKMAMEDLNYVNLEMTDSIAQLLEADELDKNKTENLKGIETQAKKVREVVKKYPIAPRVESVIEQILGVIGEADQIDIEFNSGEVVQIAAELAESILNVFMDLSEENQVKFEELISEDLVGFEDGLSFIAEAFEGMQ